MPLFLVVPLCVWVLNRRGVACCASARWKACAKRRKMVSLNVTSSGRTDLVTPTFLSSLAFVHEWYYSFSREFAIRWNSPLPLKSSRQCDKRHLRLRLYSAESWYVTRLKENKTQPVQTLLVLRRNRYQYQKPSFLLLMGGVSNSKVFFSPCVHGERYTRTAATKNKRHTTHRGTAGIKPLAHVIRPWQAAHPRPRALARGPSPPAPRARARPRFPERGRTTAWCTVCNLVAA